MAQSDSEFWNMYNGSRTEVMTAEQERQLARDLLRSKFDLWDSILSDPGEADSVVRLIFDNIQKVKTKDELDPDPIFDFQMAVTRWRRRPIQANESQMRRRRRDCVEALINFDACMEIPMLLVQSLGKSETEINDYEKKILTAYRKFIRLRNRFIERNTRLVMLVSKRFASYGIPREDLVQEGMFGLQRAVGTFDPERGFKFSTYASWWIRAVITRYCRNQGRVVRVPVGLQEKLERYYVAARRLDAEGEEFDIQVIAKMTGIPIRTAKRLQSMTLEHHRSIDVEGESGVRAHDVLADPEDRLADVDVMIDHKVIDHVMNELPDRLRYIIRARNGLDGGDGKTLQEIADTLGISRERVRQLEARALEQIRGNLKTLSSQE